ncbi:MAG: dynamin family protein [Pseudomonadota bacterium]
MMTRAVKIPAEASPETDQTPVRVVLCGEVNSGKSTVLNALMRGPVLPDLFGTKERPFIHVRTGDTAAQVVHGRDGSESTHDGLSDAVLQAAESCEIIGTSEHLAGLEIVEMPFLNERDITDEQIAYVESADIIIWTTIASQAWRLSEKTILDRCENRSSLAIMVVSRGDKLRSDEDREKLMGRLERETGDYFRDIVMMHGKDTLIAAAAEDDEAWETTAAPVLLTYLREMAEEVRDAKASALAAMVSLTSEAMDDGEMTAEIVQLKPDPETETLEAQPQEDSAFAVIAEIPEDDAPIEEKAENSPLLPAKARTALEELLPALHGCTAVGLVALDGNDEVEFLRGSEEDWAELGAACISMHLAAKEIEPAATQEPLLSHMALKSHQFIMQSFPRKKALMFMLASSARMNHGIARTAFSRLVRAYEAR